LPGAIVTVRAREVAPDLAKARGFDGPEHRFLKRLAAGGGAVVCRAGDTVTIDGTTAATIPAANIHHVHWRVCHTLRPHEALLLGDTPDSLDGRDWGPISADVIEGVWRKL
jgi:type IV secretory pathway protease TraF